MYYYHLIKAEDEMNQYSKTKSCKFSGWFEIERKYNKSFLTKCEVGTVKYWTKVFSTDRKRDVNKLFIIWLNKLLIDPHSQKKAF